MCVHLAEFRCPESSVKSRPSIDPRPLAPHSTWAGRAESVLQVLHAAASDDIALDLHSATRSRGAMLLMAPAYVTSTGAGIGTLAGGLAGELANAWGDEDEEGEDEFEFLDDDDDDDEDEDDDEEDDDDEDEDDDEEDDDEEDDDEDEELEEEEEEDDVVIDDDEEEADEADEEE